MENKITVKAKQRYFRLNYCYQMRKASLLLGILSVLIFWYVCIPDGICDAIWKDVLLMVAIGRIVSVIYLILFWITPVDLEAKRKKIEKSLVQNALRIAEVEQRGRYQKVKRLKQKQKMLEIKNKIINM